MAIIFTANNRKSRRAQTFSAQGKAEREKARAASAALQFERVRQDAARTVETVRLILLTGAKEERAQLDILPPYKLRQIRKHVRRLDARIATLFRPA